MTIDIPLAEFLCEGCRNSEREAVWHLPTPYIRFDVPVPGVNGPVTVAVDVERIVWERSDFGAYAARASVRIICPCCESVREIQHHVHACRIVVSDSAVCGKCGGSLRLDQEEIDYSGGPTENPLVTIRANLICCVCGSTQVKRSTAVAVADMLRHGSDSEVIVDGADVRLKSQADDESQAPGHRRRATRVEFKEQGTDT